MVSLTIAIVSILTFGGRDLLQGDHVPRRPGQVHYEDSLHVFRSHWPNPFSPPTLAESSKGCITGEHAFYSDISDTVDVLLVDERDSVVYSYSDASQRPPHFSVSYCLAGSQVSQQAVPEAAFRPLKDSNLWVVLSVDGRRKAMHPSTIIVKRGWSCWLRD